ncbi:hypothetical protein CH365_14495 [Leptospira neocaledonica]|uniref:Uncharacterized protein n=1 Tax=Leptospira neocaledonica TaxID=2023192 RepID=A0A2M9ZWZ3_9LEPT|nr:hypothetical protein CH365_14495 [Leptospira neocaledonica]
MIRLYGEIQNLYNKKEKEDRDIAPNDQGLTTFHALAIARLARGLLCKTSDKAKCAAGQARVAKQARSAASEPIVRRSIAPNTLHPALFCKIF